VNPHATTLILVWIAGGIVGLAVAVFNYLDAAADTRLVRGRHINGLVEHAAFNERLAEQFRALASAAFLLAGILAADGGHGDWVVFYLVLGMVAIGLSSVRARIARKVALRMALDPYHGEERRS
jgi:hypothetical protein